MRNKYGETIMPSLTDTLDILRRMLAHLDAGRAIYPGGLAHREIDTVVQAVDAAIAAASEEDDLIISEKTWRR
jgi:hypothetical protein